jgi:alpha-D-xyloside xylohydrolase
VRASHALAAPLPFVLYSDSYDHRGYVRGIAKSGFSGLLWAPELRDANSIEDLYRRVETIVFSAQTMVNCWSMKNPPWLQINTDKSNRDELMPERDEVTAAVRRLFELRMSLVPYLYSAFAGYQASGRPPFRAVVMDYPHDTNTWQLDDEYLVGSSLLVAPIFAGQKSRAVYLPEGEWFDFWTGERLPGGRKMDVTKPLDQIPVDVKSGSILPLALPVECVRPETCFDLTVRVYGSNPAALALYEDDGSSYDYEKGMQNKITLSWTPEKGGQAEKSGKYTGPPRYKVEAWKALDGR